MERTLVRKLLGEWPTKKGRIAIPSGGHHYRARLDVICHWDIWGGVFTRRETKTAGTRYYSPVGRRYDSTARAASLHGRHT
jgi:hypothetical protein